jgi:uncharacterized protein YndB with AHSA1/START domain
VHPETELRTVNGVPMLRFQRRLAHSQAKVWRAITEPAELAHWFPALVEAELRPGAPMRFTFPEEAPVDDPNSQGEVLEFDPPKVYAFRWNQDVLRFELIPDGDGCLLLFTQTVGGGPAGRLTAGRSAAGWEVCLDALQAGLAGRTPEPPTDWLARIERSVRSFGLDEGTATRTEDGHRVHFARDLMWKPVEEMWALLSEDGAPKVGDQPPLPATNGYVPVGPVTEVDAPHLLEYEWRHDDRPAGRVRWEFTHDPQIGTRVELTQTVPGDLAEVLPTALAAWHVQLELFFAATHGELRCPWPEAKTDELTRHYTERLG